MVSILLLYLQYRQRQPAVWVSADLASGIPNSNNLYQ
jgi:hypothetical protein